MSSWISVFLALGAGVFGAVQATINSDIGKTSGQWAMVVGVSLVQTVIASVMLMRSGWPAFTTSLPWVVVAGVLGVGLMFSVSTAIGSIGALAVFVLVILGQVVGSALIDQLGLFGTPRISISPQKLASIVVILIGVYGVMKS